MAPAAATTPFAELALDQSPLSLLVLDLKRRVLSANQSALGALGLERNQVVGRDLAEVIRTDDATWCSLDPVDRLGAPSIGRKLVAKVEGARRMFRVGVYPLREADQDVGIMVTLRDEEDGDPDPEEEKDHLTSLGELSACVAHEIRNPLTGIRTTVQYVGTKLDPEDPNREDLRDVITEIDRIEQIIEDLLLFARPVEGTRVEADLNGLLERILDSMTPQLEEAEVEVKRGLSPDLPPFLMSPDNIQQVMHNLIRNALEAMPEGGKLKVGTGIRRFRSDRPAEVEIVVSDTGHGIPEDLLGNIFKPFFTTRHNGTGLGLPITSSIVRAHGGRIVARNRAQGGASFRVSLPLVRETKDAS